MARVSPGCSYHYHGLRLFVAMCGGLAATAGADLDVMVWCGKIIKQPILCTFDL